MMSHPCKIPARSQHMVRSWFTWATFLELTRFGVLGLKANAIYFALYLLLTIAGVHPVLAVIAVFSFGAIYSFWLNKTLVFRNAEVPGHQFIRYLCLYAVVGAINVAALHVAITDLGINHVLAQGVLVCVLALLLFLVQKHLIFRAAEARHHASSSHEKCPQPGNKH